MRFLLGDFDLGEGFTDIRSAAPIGQIFAVLRSPCWTFFAVLDFDYTHNSWCWNGDPVEDSIQRYWVLPRSFGVSQILLKEDEVAKPSEREI